MALHIVLMNVLAPLGAALFITHMPRGLTTDKALWSSATLQLIMLWAWHVPAVERWTHSSHGLHLAAYFALFATALVFWATVIRGAGLPRWQAVAALLLTGKLTCLLSALLVFAPRALYGEIDAVAPLDDQQLAGLLMITACPLSYLVAAVVIAMRLVTDAARRGHPGAAAPS
jgi:putative membrane protein